MYRYWDTDDRRLTTWCLLGVGLIIMRGDMLLMLHLNSLHCLLGTLPIVKIVLAKSCPTSSKCCVSSVTHDTRFSSYLSDTWENILTSQSAGSSVTLFHPVSCVTNLGLNIFSGVHQRAGKGLFWRRRWWEPVLNSCSLALYMVYTGAGVSGSVWGQMWGSSVMTGRGRQSTGPGHCYSVSCERDTMTRRESHTFQINKSKMRL